MSPGPHLGAHGVGAGGAGGGAGVLGDVRAPGTVDDHAADEVGVVVVLVVDDGTQVEFVESKL